MVKKIRGKLGTYSNDGLGSVFEIDENIMEEMRVIVSNDLTTIKEDYSKVIKRLEVFIKDKIGAYPDEDNFSKYFFDKKAINQWGDKIPKITDEEVLECALGYYNQLEQKLSKLKTEPNKKKSKTSFRWLKSEHSIEKLYNGLIDCKFIDKNTTYSSFKLIFSEVLLSELTSKINWLKKAKNKNVNKKSISDLIHVLMEKKYIDKKDALPSILSACFRHNEEELKFTHSNLSKENNHSEHILDIEELVEKI